MSATTTLDRPASPTALESTGLGDYQDESAADMAIAKQETALTSTTEETSLEKKPQKKITKKRRRPARVQVDPSTLKTGELPPQTGTVFNIWYNKWSGGDREDKYLSKQHAEGRCNVARDSGYTRADKVAGSYFCLFFARGLCPKGHECEYLHRLPTLHDLFNPNIDCFGRDKFSDYRDDMGGVGSFMRQNRTLYVGRIHVSDDIEEIVARHFAEWGQVERSMFLSVPCSPWTAKEISMTEASADTLPNSTSPQLPRRRFRNIHQRSQLAIRQRSHGASVTRPQRNSQRPLGHR